MIEVTSQPINFDDFASDQIWTSNTGESFLRITSKNEELERRVVSFGLFDGKGREIGAKIEIGIETISPSSNANGGWIFKEWVGQKFYVVCQATRNGESFGSSQAAKTFQTFGEVEQHVARYLENARKRAAK